MKKYSKQMVWFLIVIIISIGIRILAHGYFPKYQYTGDSSSYFATAKIIVDTHQFVDSWRTPGYPMLMIIPFKILGTSMPENIHSNFIKELWYLRLAQSIMGILSVLFLYAILLRIGVWEWAAGVFSILMACNRTFLAFEATLLTETVSMLLLLSIVYCSIRLFQKFQSNFVFIVLLLSIFLVFIRPSEILLPIFIFVLIVLHIRKKEAVIVSILACVCYVMVLSIYVKANTLYHEYPGLSRVSDVNLLGIIAKHELSIETVEEYGGIKGKVREYLAQKELLQAPWQLYVLYPELLENKNAQIMSTFVHEVIRNNFSTYLWKSILVFPSAFLDRSEFSEFVTTNATYEWLFGPLKVLDRWVQIVNVCILFVVPLSFIAYIRKRTIHTASILLVSVVAVYHAVVVVFVSYGEYARLMLPAQPVMNFVSLYWVYSLWVFFRKGIYK